MLYLIRKNKQDNSFVDMQSVEKVYIHEYKEVEELEAKQGFTIQYEYDKETDKIVGKYVEIPKTEVEKLQEEILKVKKAIAEKINVEDINFDELN